MGELALDERELDRLCYTVFKAMDVLGLLPLSIRSRETTPSRLEKYPRLLLGYLQRYDDPIMAYKEWVSKLLRDVPNDDANFRKDKYFCMLGDIEKCLEENRDAFKGRNKKLIVQHLRGSLYARIFAYLYPRRAICFAVSDEVRDGKGSYEEALQKFDDIVDHAYELEQVKEIISDDEWRVAVEDAKQIFTESSAFFKKIISGKANNAVVETFKDVEDEGEDYDDEQ